jgi:maltose O-acetyltransferase
MPTSRRREVLGYLAGHVLAPTRLRLRLLRAAGVTFEGSVELLSGLRVTGEGRLTVGDGCFLNHDCLIDAAADVRIGRRVALGNRVMLLTSGHDHSDPRLRAGSRVLRPIEVGDGAWLGAGVIVVGGVTVGEGAVVAAGAVVRCDVPPHTLWGGVPARQLRALPVHAEALALASAHGRPWAEPADVGHHLA